MLQLTYGELAGCGSKPYACDLNRCAQARQPVMAVEKALPCRVFFRSEEEMLGTVATTCHVRVDQARGITKKGIRHEFRAAISSTPELHIV